MVMLSAGKRTSTKTTVIFLLASLIGIALTVDFFWASSSSSATATPFSSISKNQILVRNDTEQTVVDEVKKNHVSEGDLSGTFADLAAPELEWEQMPSAPVPRLDGSAIQIEDLL